MSKLSRIETGLGTWSWPPKCRPPRCRKTWTPRRAGHRSGLSWLPWPKETTVLDDASFRIASRIDTDVAGSRRGPGVALTRDVRGLFGRCSNLARQITKSRRSRGRERRARDDPASWTCRPRSDRLRVPAAAGFDMPFNGSAKQARRDGLRLRCSRRSYRASNRNPTPGSVWTWRTVASPGGSSFLRRRAIWVRSAWVSLA